MISVVANVSANSKKDTESGTNVDESRGSLAPAAPWLHTYASEAQRCVVL